MKKQKLSIASLKGKLSRGEMKSIMGGNPPIGGDGDNYSCCLEFTDNTTETVTVCAESKMAATIAAIGGRSNVYSPDCTLS